MDFAQSACLLLAELNYLASPAETERLSTKLRIVEDAGLAALNRRLLEGGRKIVDTIKELNVVAQILECGRGVLRIEYEPEGPVRPPDFRVSTKEATFWIQMKNLSNLERENRQSKLVDRIRQSVAKIPVGRYLTISIAEDFTEDEGQLLSSHLGAAVTAAADQVDYPFMIAGEQRGSYTLAWPRSTKLEVVTLVASADLEMIDLTGLAPAQIRGSLKKAARAFMWPVTPSIINLIAVDCNMHDDIDLCDAIYGTEFDIFRPNGGGSWSRDPNGFFPIDAPITNVAGVLSLRAVDRSPVSDYSIRCFINEHHVDTLAAIERLLPMKPAIHYKMRPEPPHGKFSRAMMANKSLEQSPEVVFFFVRMSFVGFASRW